MNAKTAKAIRRIVKKHEISPEGAKLFKKMVKAGNKPTEKLALQLDISMNLARMQALDAANPIDPEKIGEMQTEERGGRSRWRMR